MRSEIHSRYSHEKIQKWFIQCAWLQGWCIAPDRSIDKRTFYETYFRTQALWDKAFDFLADEDLDKMGAKDFQLDGDKLLVKCQKYFTKDAKETRYEAHRKYADIQYVISGTEQIGIVNLEKAKVVVPYDDVNDVVFLSTEEDHYHIATNRNFFIFLPGDAHRPCVNNGISTFVKKIVIKVRIF